jgi:hypothetical protein
VLDGGGDDVFARRVQMTHQPENREVVRLGAAASYNQLPWSAAYRAGNRKTSAFEFTPGQLPCPMRAGRIAGIVAKRGRESLNYFGRDRSGRIVIEIQQTIGARVGLGEESRDSPTILTANAAPDHYAHD